MLLSQLHAPRPSPQFGEHAVTHCHELAALTHLLPLAEWVRLASSQMWQSG